MIGVETLGTADHGMHSISLDVVSWHRDNLKPVQTLVWTILNELMSGGKAIVLWHKTKSVAQFNFWK